MGKLLTYLILNAAALTISATALAQEQPQAKEESFFAEKKIKPLPAKRLYALFENHSITMKNLESDKTSVAFYDHTPDGWPDYVERSDGEEIGWEISKNAVIETDQKGNKGDKNYSVYEFEKVLYVCGFSRKGYCGDIILDSVKGSKFK